MHGSAAAHQVGGMREVINQSIQHSLTANGRTIECMCNDLAAKQNISI
jgi:hypothetical protein